MKDLETRWNGLPEELRAAYVQKYLKQFQVNIKLAKASCVFIYFFLK